MGHTPGPWEIVRDGGGYVSSIAAPNGCDFTPGAVGTRVLRRPAFMLPSSQEAEANASLIAAAPCLLEALRYAEVALDLGAETKGAPAMVLPRVRAAIAKATSQAAPSAPPAEGTLSPAIGAELANGEAK